MINITRSPKLAIFSMKIQMFFWNINNKLIDMLTEEKDDRLEIKYNRFITNFIIKISNMFKFIGDISRKISHSIIDNISNSYIRN